jgi:hypothetical protein
MLGYKINRKTRQIKKSTCHKITKSIYSKFVRTPVNNVNLISVLIDCKKSMPRKNPSNVLCSFKNLFYQISKKEHTKNKTSSKHQLIECTKSMFTNLLIKLATNVLRFCTVDFFPRHPPSLLIGYLIAKKFSVNF